MKERILLAETQTTMLFRWPRSAEAKVERKAMTMEVAEAEAVVAVVLATKRAAAKAEKVAKAAAVAKAATVLASGSKTSNSYRTTTA
jgi:hypothetical protein